MSATIHKVDFTNGRDYKVAKQAIEFLCDILEDNEHPVGFAMVVWDKNGVGSTAVRTEGGMGVGASLIPAYAHSMFTRHLGSLVLSE